VSNKIYTHAINTSILLSTHLYTFCTLSPVSILSFFHLSHTYYDPWSICMPAHCKYLFHSSCTCHFHGSCVFFWFHASRMHDFMCVKSVQNNIYTHTHIRDKQNTHYHILVHLCVFFRFHVCPRAYKIRSTHTFLLSKQKTHYRICRLHVSRVSVFICACLHMCRVCTK